MLSINSEAPISTNSATPKRIGDLLSESATRLSTLGVIDSRKEAAHILAVAAGMPVADVFMRAETELPSASVSSAETLVGRRVAGEPLQYVLGVAGFRTLELFVDSRVLIPRPETEGLVEVVLSWSSKRDIKTDVLEIGAGSGCIAISLAVEGDFDSITAVDVCDEALNVAKLNASRYLEAANIVWRHGAFFESVSDGSFDVIVSNPPYIAPVEYERLDRSVLDFEPETALKSEEEGMQHIRTIVQGAGRHLNPGGLLALEVDSRRAERAGRLAEENGFVLVEILNDVFDRPRFVIAERPS
ncbi:MAG: peptide chain release factor N(5)-glutamine methyltransferase [Gemmatimonadota bacterium]|nr:peptide chain release factor N(5)-glutamine methyltransferase [Gemmatimonadota bacterium]